MCRQVILLLDFDAHDMSRQVIILLDFEAHYMCGQVVELLDFEAHDMCHQVVELLEYQAQEVSLGGTVPQSSKYQIIFNCRIYFLDMRYLWQYHRLQKHIFFQTSRFYKQQIQSNKCQNNSCNHHKKLSWVMLFLQWGIVFFNFSKLSLFLLHFTIF